MRPQRIAAEYLEQAGPGAGNLLASMRPQRIAAEYRHLPEIGRREWSCFNEAAANRCGILNSLVVW